MKKFIILTPEQFAKLQKGAERVLDEESKREKELSNLVSHLKPQVKPEQFDKYQDLFHRFIADQKSLRRSIQVPLESSYEGDDASAPVDGGLSFHYGEDDKNDLTSVRPQSAQELPSNYSAFASRKRRLPRSTPDKNKKKKKFDITPNFSKSPNLKTRSRNLKWDVRPLK